jgi:hypothetical protein
VPCFCDVSHGAADDSPDRDSYSIEAAKVSAWHKPTPGPLPHYTYVRSTRRMYCRIIQNRFALTVDDAKSVDT